MSNVLYRKELGRKVNNGLARVNKTQRHKGSGRMELGRRKHVKNLCEKVNKEVQKLELGLVRGGNRRGRGGRRGGKEREEMEI